MTTDRLALLVRFDIADTLRSLGAKHAAGLAAIADCADEWLTARTCALSLPVSDVTRFARSAAIAASAAMVTGDVQGAARLMAFVRDDTMTLDAYAAEIAAEALAAGASL